MVLVLARVFLATNIESNEFEGIDKSLAALVNREQTDSEEGAKDPDDADNDPACDKFSMVSEVNRQSYSCGEGYVDGCTCKELLAENVSRAVHCCDIKGQPGPLLIRRAHLTRRETYASATAPRRQMSWPPSRFC